MRALFIVICISISSVFAQGDVVQTATSIFTPQGATSTAGSNKLIVQYYYKAFQDNKPDALLNTLSPNYGIVNANLLNDTSFYQHPTMSKNQKVRMEAMHKSFPDLTIQVMELIAEQNRVFAYVTYTGTQKGEFLGLAPTGKPIVIKQFAVFSVENGRIVHITEMDNEFSVMQQLGYVLLK